MDLKIMHRCLEIICIPNSCLQTWVSCNCWSTHAHTLTSRTHAQTEIQNSEKDIEQKRPIFSLPSTTNVPDNSLHYKTLRAKGKSTHQQDRQA
jgi:hypothetical protein